MENPEFIQKIKDCSGNERKQLIKEEQQKQMINMICRQTDYDEDTAKEKILQHNGNFMNVIKEYMDPNFKTKQQDKIKDMNNKSTNQKIYGEIRNFMDTASRGYEIRKRRDEILQERILALQKQKAEHDSKKNQDDDSKEEIKNDDDNKKI